MSEEVLLSSTLFIFQGHLFNKDSKPILEELGFSIVRTENSSYRVLLPKGWSVENTGFMMFIHDSNGIARVMQFLDDSPNLNIS